VEDIAEDEVGDCRWKTTTARILNDLQTTIGRADMTPAHDHQ